MQSFVNKNSKSLLKIVKENNKNNKQTTEKIIEKITKVDLH